MAIWNDEGKKLEKSWGQDARNLYWNDMGLPKVMESTI